MRAALAVAFLMVFGGLFLATVSGQDPVPVEGTIFFTNKLIADNTVSGNGGPKIFDTTATPPASATAQKAYANLGTGAAALETQFHWKPTEAVTLTGGVKAKVFTSCDVATPYRGVGATTARFTLLKNGASAGPSHSLTDAAPTVCTGPTSIREFNFLVAFEELKLKAGDTLSAGFAVWMLSPPEAAAKNFHYLVGSTARASVITAVGIPPPPGSAPAVPAAKVIEETLEGETAAVSQSFDNATSDTYRFNWTTELANATIDHNVTVTNGSVQLKVLDGEANELLNITIDADSADETEVVEAKPGTWTIELAYSAFQGSTELAIALTATSEPPPTANETTAANATEDDGQAQEDDGGGIPSLGVLGAAVAVATAFAVRRRRN